MRLLCVRQIVIVFGIAALSSTGCRLGKFWPGLTDNRPVQSSAAVQSAPIPRTIAESEGTTASLQSASAKIDRAAASPESEPRSYYSSGQEGGGSSSRSTCSSGCCK
jgi:hypothetical protein